jgi:hypothetical protein
LEDIKSLDDAILLAQAIDEYLLTPLHAYCNDNVKKMLSLDNIWDTINQHHEIPDFVQGALKEVNLLINAFCVI